MASDPLFCISHSGGPRAGIRRGGEIGAPKCPGISRITAPSVMKAMIRF
jgi:hypothetical protein